jgi:hypothetical protein
MPKMQFHRISSPKEMVYFLGLSEISSHLFVYNDIEIWELFHRVNAQMHKRLFDQVSILPLDDGS